MRVHILFFAGLWAAALGCGSGHLTSGFGRANHEALAMQQGNRAKPPPANMALDSQEAAVISKSYLKSLAGPEQTTAPEPVLIVTSRSGQQEGQPAPLAPSVPKQ
jgi:hypothetical protein